MEGRRHLAGAFLIQLDRIRPDPAQPRRQLDSQTQHEMNESVRQLGVMQAISVRYLAEADIYQIISGERRYQAAKFNGLAEIPCWVQSPKEDEVLLRQTVENWLRKDLSPFELADALAAIRDAHRYSQDDLARMTGKPKSEISKLLALLSLHPAAQQFARSHPEIGRRQLYAISRMKSEQHRGLVERTLRDGLTAEQLEKLIAQEQPKASGARRAGAPTAYRRFVTSRATVTLTFRRRDVSDADVLVALDEARDQAANAATGTTV